MSSKSPLPEPNRNIQVWPLIVAGLTRCWSARDDLLRLGVIPVILDFLIMMPMIGMLPIFMADPPDSTAVANATPTALLLILSHAAVTSVFSVNLLRVLTLGSSSGSFLGLDIRGRHLRYFFFRVGVGLLTLVVLMLLVVILQGFGRLGVGTGVILATLFYMTLIVRLTPCWIGIAIDAPMPFLVGWRQTRGQGAKLVLVLIMITVGGIIAEQLVGIVFHATGLVSAAPLAFIFLICVAEMILVALQLAALLAAYPQFVRETV